MKSVFLFTIALAGLAMAASAQQKPQVIFFDDFNGKTLDRTKWNVEITGRTVNNEQQAYVDSLATIYLVKGKNAQGAKNGALVLKAVWQPGYTSKEQKKYDFLSGRINTRNKFMFTHGTFSARMKVTGGEGMWPAFWALGQGKWPDCGEIDVMETVGDAKWISHALHGPGYFGNTPLAHRQFFPEDKHTDATQWHVYTAEWSPESIIFKVDDVITYTVTKQMVEKYGKWAFDNPKFLILNYALGGGYPHGVNKVETPYFGLSQASVDVIKAGNAKVLVDWVRVTK